MQDVCLVLSAHSFQRAKCTENIRSQVLVMHAPYHSHYEVRYVQASQGVPVCPNTWSEHSYCLREAHGLGDKLPV